MSSRGGNNVAKRPPAKGFRDTDDGEFYPHGAAYGADDDAASSISPMDMGPAFATKSKKSAAKATTVVPPAGNNNGAVVAPSPQKTTVSFASATGPGGSSSPASPPVPPPPPQPQQRTGGAGGRLPSSKHDDDDEEETAAIDRELARLKELVLTNAKAGGLEVKYFEQVKRNRELVVRLESEKNRVAKLQNQIVDMERSRAEAERLAMKGVLMPSEAARMTTLTPATAALLAASRQQSSAANAATAAEAEAEILAAQVEELRGKLDRSSRSNTNLRQQLDRRRTILQKLKGLMLQEIGSEQDLEKALGQAGLAITCFADAPAGSSGGLDDSNAAADGDLVGLGPPDAAPQSPTAGGLGASSAPAATTTTAGGGKKGPSVPSSPSTGLTREGGAAPTLFGASVASTGWKGRAHQIALLKSRVKDLQREMDSLRQHVAENGEGTGAAVGRRPLIGEDYDIASTINFDGPEGPRVTTATERTMASKRTAAGSIGGGGGAPSAVSGMTHRTVRSTTTTVRDVDDAQRDRLEATERKRMQESREIANLLRQRDEELGKERHKCESLTARVQILDRDNQHIKNCLSRLVEKAENDHQLIVAYKADIEAKDLELGRYRRGELTATRGGATGKDNSSAELGRLASDNARLSETVSELRMQLSRTMAAASMATRQHPPSTLVESLPPEDALVELFRRQGVKSDDGTLLGSAKAIIERQRHAIIALETHLQKLTAQSNATASVAGSGATATERAVREENSALRERVEALVELMNKEIMLHKTIAESTTAQRTVNRTHSAGGEDHERSSAERSLRQVTSAPSSSSHAAAVSRSTTQPTNAQRSAARPSDGKAPASTLPPIKMQTGPRLGSSVRAHALAGAVRADTSSDATDRISPQPPSARENAAGLAQRRSTRNAALPATNATDVKSDVEEGDRRVVHDNDEDDDDNRALELAAKARRVDNDEDDIDEATSGPQWGPAGRGGKRTDPRPQAVSSLSPAAEAGGSASVDSSSLNAAKNSGRGSSATEAELEAVKQQYDQLRKAYNTLASKQQA